MFSAKAGRIYAFLFLAVSTFFVVRSEQDIHHPNINHIELKEDKRSQVKTTSEISLHDTLEQKISKTPDKGYKYIKKAVGFENDNLLLSLLLSLSIIIVVKLLFDKKKLQESNKGKWNKDDRQLDTSPETETSTDESDAIPVSGIQGANKMDTSSILVIHNEAEDCVLIKEILSNSHALEFKYKGEDIISYLKDKKPDLIIINELLMDMKGIDLILELKKHRGINFIPIIMMSSFYLLSKEIQAYTAGVDLYISCQKTKANLNLEVDRVLNTKKTKTKGLYPLGDLNYEGKKISINDQLWLIDLEIIVLNNLKDPHFNIKEIAEALDLNSQQLSKKIKSITGITAKKFILDIKFWEARSMLLLGEQQTVKEVSYAVGFKDQKYFSKKFKEKFDRYPSECLNR